MVTCKRNSAKRVWLAIVIIASLTSALPTAAQSENDKARISAALLTTPDRCDAPCIWTLQPGTDPMSVFEQFAVDLFPANKLRQPDQFNQSMYADGVGVYGFLDPRSGEARILGYMWVRVQPAAATAAGYDITHFTPAAMIKALGNPDRAYLLFSKPNLAQGTVDIFRLILVYESRRAAYVILGTFHEYQACLTDDAETLTLYRLIQGYGLGTMSPSIWNFVFGNDALPPSITETTNQTVADFTRMAQHPDTDCLTLK